MSLFTLNKEERNKLLTNSYNPLNYPTNYYEIYNREKSYRNLQNYDNLINITNENIDLDYSPNVEENLIYAPKDQVPYDFKLDKIINKLNEILKSYSQYIFICGGAALYYYAYKNVQITIDNNDVDIFLSYADENIAKEILLTIFNNNEFSSFSISEGAFSFKMNVEGEMFKIQIIKRLYQSPSEIIHGFDIDCSCILLTMDKKIFITERGLYSLKNQTNFINFDKLSPSYEDRLYKYYKRGFSMWIPEIQFFKQNFITDFRPYQRLEGSLKLYYNLLNGKKYTKSLSDYSNQESTFDDIQQIYDIKFKTLNPHEQISSTFNKTVHDDIKNWYVETNFVNYEYPPFLEKGNIHEIFESDIILGTNIRQSYFPKILRKVKENDYFNHLVTFLEIMGSDFVIVGSVALEALTNTQLFLKKKTLYQPEFCYVGKSDEFRTHLITLIEKIKTIYDSILDYKDSLDTMIDNFLNKPLTYEKMYIHFISSSINFGIIIHNRVFTDKRLIFDTQKNDIYRCYLTHEGKYYSDSIGKYNILYRYNNHSIINEYKFGITKIKEDINDIIDNIFVLYKNKKFKFYDNPRQLSELKGPTNFSFYKNFGENRRLLILGEKHETKDIQENENPNSFDVNIWLRKLSEQTPECLDIFLETNFVSSMSNKIFKNLKDFVTPIFAISNEFIDCLPQKKCFSSFVRYHLIDLRRIDSEESPFIKISGYIQNIQAIRGFEGFEGLANNYQIKINYGQIKTNYYNLEDFGNQISQSFLNRFLVKEKKNNKYKVLRYYSGWGDVKNKKNPEDKLLYEKAYSIMTYNLKSNFETKYDSYFVSKLDSYFELYIPKIKKAISKIPNFNVDLFFDTLIKCYDKVELNFIESLVAIHMDVYFLLRYLQTFNKLERGPQGCRDSSIAKNSIIYAGYSHSRVYNQFIKTWFNTNPIIEIKQDYSIQNVVLSEPFDFFG